MSPYFVHITDLHLSGHEPGWEALRAFVAQVQDMKPAPDFIVNGGDVVSADLRLQSDPREVAQWLGRYRQIMQPLSMPIYHVMGNHDLCRDDEAEPSLQGKRAFIAALGPRYQSFRWGPMLCLTLDTWQCPRGDNGQRVVTLGIDDPQLCWIKDQLAACQPGQTVLLLSHHRLQDEPCAWSRLRRVLPGHLRYVEVTGCDHQNAVWRDGNWTTHVTGSFCGGWWNGPCIDTSPAGYALVALHSSGQVQHFYRSTRGRLAIHSPRHGQVIDHELHVEAWNPRNGSRVTPVVDASSWQPGWHTIAVDVGGVTEPVEVFRRPGIERGACSRRVVLTVQWVTPPDQPVAVYCNDALVGRIPQQAATATLALPPDCLGPWITIRFAGSGRMRTPTLQTDDHLVYEARLSRLTDARPAWFGAERDMAWDISAACPPAPTLYPGNEFFFQLGNDGDVSR